MPLNEGWMGAQGTHGASLASAFMALSLPTGSLYMDTYTFATCNTANLE